LQKHQGANWVHAKLEARVYVLDSSKSFIQKES